MDDASGFLHYASAERKMPNYSLDVTSITSVVASGKPEKEKVSYVTDKGLKTSLFHTSAAYGFEICTASAEPNLYVYALTADAAKAWVDGLQQRAGKSCGVGPSLLDATAMPFKDATGASPQKQPMACLAQGWLHKQNSVGGARNPLSGTKKLAKEGSWVKRYFRLDAQGFLSYGASETTLEVRKAIPLSTLSSVVELTTEESGRPTPHCFQLLLCTGRALSLCASNREDLRMWINQLSAHLDSLQAMGASNRLRASGQMLNPAEADEASTHHSEQPDRIKLYKPEKASHLGITLKCATGCVSPTSFAHCCALRSATATIPAHRSMPHLCS